MSDPLWGARYSFQLTCAYSGLEIDCGEHQSEDPASDPVAREAGRGCFEHGDECPLADRVRFAAPKRWGKKYYNFPYFGNRIILNIQI